MVTVGIVGMPWQRAYSTPPFDVHQILFICPAGRAFALAGAKTTPPGQRDGTKSPTGCCTRGRLEPKGQRPQGRPRDGHESLVLRCGRRRVLRRPAMGHRVAPDGRHRWKRLALLGEPFACSEPPNHPDGEE